MSHFRRDCCFVDSSFKIESTHCSVDFSDFLHTHHYLVQRVPKGLEAWLDDVVGKPDAKRIKNMYTMTTVYRLVHGLDVVHSPICDAASTVFCLSQSGEMTRLRALRDL